jgi:hypothetical protein
MTESDKTNLPLISSLNGRVQKQAPAPDKHLWKMVLLDTGYICTYIFACGEFCFELERGPRDEPWTLWSEHWPLGVTTWDPWAEKAIAFVPSCGLRALYWLPLACKISDTKYSVVATVLLLQYCCYSIVATVLLTVLLLQNTVMLLDNT